MRARWQLMVASLCTFYAMAASSAEIAFSAQIDFTEINLNIKDGYRSNPDLVVLDVTLSPDAQRRLEQISRTALEQDLTITINGRTVATSRVQGVLDTPQLNINLSRQAATDLLPALLGTATSTPPASQSGADPMLPDTAPKE
ncbi:hypothetical protein [Paraherbaspirillum soli]|uniref:AMIN domain-containing protein n=1 Tax=Paraherbaspirillum soli TaxID=631222 RepID=A0ABW0M5S3_9BURK